MKYIISICMIMMLGVSSLYAGEGHDATATSPYKDVQELDGDFEITLNDDKTVTASWDDFPDGEGFLWYKLMYSTANSAPVYPDQGAVFVGTNRTDVENTFKLKYGKKHYIRLCVITEEEDYKKGRYCSEVKKLEVENIGSVKNYTTKKVDATKEYETKNTTYKKKKVQLTSNLKNRVDAMLEKFIDRLESKGYSDEKKLVAIDRVISKLETLKEKNERYERLVDYMMEQLEEYRNEIDDGLGEIESIFEDF